MLVVRTKSAGRPKEYSLRNTGRDRPDVGGGVFQGEGLHRPRINSCEARKGNKKHPENRKSRQFWRPNFGLKKAPSFL